MISLCMTIILAIRYQILATCAIFIYYTYLLLLSPQFNSHNYFILFRNSILLFIFKELGFFLIIYFIFYFLFLLASFCLFFIFFALKTMIFIVIHFCLSHISVGFYLHFHIYSYYYNYIIAVIYFDNLNGR